MVNDEDENVFVRCQAHEVRAHERTSGQIEGLGGRGVGEAERFTHAVNPFAG